MSVIVMHSFWSSTQKCPFDSLAFPQCKCTNGGQVKVTCAAQQLLHAFHGATCRECRDITQVRETNRLWSSTHLLPLMYSPALPPTDHHQRQVVRGRRGAHAPCHISQEEQAQEEEGQQGRGRSCRGRIGTAIMLGESSEEMSSRGMGQGRNEDHITMVCSTLVWT